MSTVHEDFDNAPKGEGEIPPCPDVEVSADIDEAKVMARELTRLAIIRQASRRSSQDTMPVWEEDFTQVMQHFRSV